MAHRHTPVALVLEKLRQEDSEARLGLPRETLSLKQQISPVPKRNQETPRTRSLSQSIVYERGVYTSMYACIFAYACVSQCVCVHNVTWFQTPKSTPVVFGEAQIVKSHPYDPT